MSNAPSEDKPKRTKITKGPPADHYAAMNQAYQRLNEAHASYKEALAIAADTERSSDGFLAVQQTGRQYAEAVLRYSEAAMACLGQTESNPEAALKFIRNAQSGE